MKNAVTLGVNKGLYSVLLGDTSLDGMAELPASIEIETRRDAGSHVVPGLTAIEITELTIDFTGLAIGDSMSLSLPSDSDNSSAFDDLDDVQFALEKLAERDEPLVTALPRQPGQKEGRYAHLLAGEPDIPEPTRAAPAPVRAAGGRRSVSSGSPYEPVVGFSRAVRIGNAIAVSGTGPLGPDGETVGPGDIAAQMRRCVEIALAALEELGATPEDVIRTRTFLKRREEAGQG